MLILKAEVFPPDNLISDTLTASLFLFTIFILLVVEPTEVKMVSNNTSLLEIFS